MRKVRVNFIKGLPVEGSLVCESLYILVLKIENKFYLINKLKIKEDNVLEDGTIKKGVETLL